MKYLISGLLVLTMFSCSSNKCDNKGKCDTDSCKVDTTKCDTTKVDSTRH